MMTAEEFVQNLEPEKGQGNFKLATVVELFDIDTAKIQFDGEDTPSEKQYAYLTSYTPKLNDRVLLCIVGGTYIILGKISYNEEPSNLIDEEINDIKGTIVTINNNIDTINDNINTINSDVTAVEGSLDSVNNALVYKINSNMTNDSGGNMNIDYMFVDPNTGQLSVRRKNGSWNYYNSI